MLDIKFVRENTEQVKANLEKRKDLDKIKWIDKVLKYDVKRRDLIKQTDELKHKRNKVSNEIAKKKDEEKIKEMKKIGEKIKKNDEEIKKLDEKIRNILLRIPNMLHESVPVGEDENDNVEIKRQGENEFDFEPKNHLDILINHGLIDQERAGKTAGAGFYYMKGDLALLDQALMRYAIDFLSKRGYTLVNPPYMLRKKPYEGVTDLDDFENVMYKIEDDELYLIATSEHPIASMFMDETLLEKNLPLKYMGISPCFRKEVGSHGKYTKGLYRMHQFHKIEQFIFCKPEESWKLHEELQKNTEDMIKELGIPYRVVNVCTGDIGSIAAKKYDIEFLMADGNYRELGSNSNCTDYQARRLNIKYREEEGKPAKGHVHTLNNTGIATSRCMIAIIENNQQKDGSVLIPKVLQPYMNNKTKLEPLNKI